jgi:hypothetical protein
MKIVETSAISGCSIRENIEAASSLRKSIEENCSIESGAGYQHLSATYSLGTM